MFENRMLKRIFEPKEFHYACLSPNIKTIKSRIIKWAKHVAHMRMMINSYTVFVRKPEVKRPLGGQHGDNINMDRKEIGW
jgi:hypothetical protein